MDTEEETPIGLGSVTYTLKTADSGQGVTLNDFLVQLGQAIFLFADGQSKDLAIDEINAQSRRLYEINRELMRSVDSYKYTVENFKAIREAISGLDETGALQSQYEREKRHRKRANIATISRLEFWLDNVREFIVRVPPNLILAATTLPFIADIQVHALYCRSTVSGCVYDIGSGTVQCPYCSRVSTIRKIHCSHCFFLFPLKMRNEILKVAIITSRILRKDISDSGTVHDRIITLKELFSMTIGDSINISSYLTYCRKLSPSDVFFHGKVIMKSKYLDPRYNYLRASIYLSLIRASRLGFGMNNTLLPAEVLMFTAYDMYFSDFSNYSLPVIMGYPLDTKALQDSDVATLVRIYGEISDKNKSQKSIPASAEDKAGQVFGSVLPSELIFERYISLDNALTSMEQLQYISREPVDIVNAFTENASDESILRDILSILQLIAGQLIGYQLDIAVNSHISIAKELRNLKVPKKGALTNFKERLPMTIEATKLGLYSGTYATLLEMAKITELASLYKNRVYHENIIAVTQALRCMNSQVHDMRDDLWCTLHAMNNHLITWVSNKGVSASYQCYRTMGIFELTRFPWVGKLGLFYFELSPTQTTPPVLKLEFLTTPYTIVPTEEGIMSSLDMAIIIVDSERKQIYAPFAVTMYINRLVIIESSPTDIGLHTNIAMTACSLELIYATHLAYNSEYLRENIAARHILLGPTMHALNSIGRLDLPFEFSPSLSSDEILEIHTKRLSHGQQVGSIESGLIDQFWMRPVPVSVEFQPVLVTPTNNDFYYSGCGVIAASHGKSIAQIIYTIVRLFESSSKIIKIEDWKGIVAECSSAMVADILDQILPDSPRKPINRRLENVSFKNKEYHDILQKYYNAIQRPIVIESAPIPAKTYSVQVPPLESDVVVVDVEEEVAMKQEEEMVEEEVLKAVKNGQPIPSVVLGWEIIDRAAADPNEKFEPGMRQYVWTGTARLRLIS